MSTAQEASGLTLIELLVAILVAATLLTVAVPSFERMREASKITVELNKLVRAVHVAKMEAAKTGHHAVICPTIDGLRCAPLTADWQSGWLLFANLDGLHPPQVDRPDLILAVHTLPPGLQIKVNRKTFIFRRFPRRSTNGTFVVCSAGRRAPARAVVVSYTGRPRTARLRSDGKPYSCQR